MSENEELLLSLFDVDEYEEEYLLSLFEEDLNGSKGKGKGGKNR